MQDRAAINITLGIRLMPAFVLHMYELYVSFSDLTVDEYVDAKEEHTGVFTLCKPTS